MKHLLLILVFLFFFQSTFTQVDKGGFTSIFDGKSLSGWTINKDNPESFSVKDGILVVDGGKSHIFYSGEVGNADFKNFELKMKVRTTKGSNSGVYFHTEYQKRGWPKLGFEAQVNSTHTDPKKTGSLYGVVNIFAPIDVEPFLAKVGKNRETYIYQEKAPSTDGEWFDYHIMVQDKRIVIRVDGKIMVDWTQPSDWSKDRRIGHGTVGIQAHDPKSITHYKDIRIKVLD